MYDCMCVYRHVYLFVCMYLCIWEGVLSHLKTISSSFCECMWKDHLCALCVSVREGICHQVWLDMENGRNFKTKEE